MVKRQKVIFLVLYVKHGSTTIICLSTEGILRGIGLQEVVDHQESVFIIYRFTHTLLKVKGVSFFHSFLPASTIKNKLAN